jgi:hypothetical protein
MRNLFIFTALIVLSALLEETAFSQASVNQSVTLAVNPIYRMSVSGNPAPLTITDGVAGDDNLTPVSDNSTTYNITQNVGNTIKITAEIDAALASGYTLELNLASSKGTSAGDMDISNAVSGSAVDVVTGISRGADANRSILYTFSATATAGTLASTVRTVTLTLTN